MFLDLGKKGIELWGVWRIWNLIIFIFQEFSPELHLSIFQSQQKLTIQNCFSFACDKLEFPTNDY